MHFTNTQLADYSMVFRLVEQDRALKQTKQMLDGQVWSEQLLLEQLEQLCGLSLCDVHSEQLGIGLRRLRRAAVACLAEMDLCKGASLETITGNISTLGDFALKTALKTTGLELAKRYGHPVQPDGTALDLQVIAMGKLGGNELNVSSDIDIVFLCQHCEGDTLGAITRGLRLSIGNHEFLNQWARQCIALLNTQTTDGFVFRVDTRLRPHGTSGPLVMEHDALDGYLVAQGRMWERLAWLKARPVLAPVFETDENHAKGHALWQSIVEPFVYRRYLDFTVIEALRDLHSKIRFERIAEERKNTHGIHVKLARGGIRELEFWVQGQLLIRAGRDPNLRKKDTLSALAALHSSQTITHEQSQSMALHYRFLRRCEHAAQFVADQQTHLMPKDDVLRFALAQSLGFTTLSDFDQTLRETMIQVADLFDDLFPHATETQHEASVGFSEIPTCLQEWQAKANELAVSEATSLTLQSLLHRMYCDDHVLFERLARFACSIAKRKTYIDLLLTHPLALQRLVGLIQASHFAEEYLNRYPALLDELIDKDALYCKMDSQYWEGEKTRLYQRLAFQDEETQLHALREAHHAWVFRVLAQDLGTTIDLKQVSDALSQAAEIILEAALSCVNAKFTGQFEVPKGLGIIAYGKLGGKELGYGSDLDIVFIYEPSEAGVENHPRLIQRLIAWLTAQTVVGRLFEIDTALRPNGSAGLMLSTIESFEQYQLGQAAGTHAWLWEHQAISRARCIIGSSHLKIAFEDIRERVLCLPRADELLKSELIKMRHTLHQTNAPKKPGFDPKHSPLGMVSIEFAVQYLVLKHSRDYPVMKVNLGNAGLLMMAGKVGILDPDLAQACAQAYLDLRFAHHTRYLQGLSKTNLDHTASHTQSLIQTAKPIMKLWSDLGLCWNVLEDANN